MGVGTEARRQVGAGVWREAKSFRADLGLVYFQKIFKIFHILRHIKSLDTWNIKYR